MRKDSQVIFAVSIALTLAIVGGVHYLYLQDQKKMAGTNPATHQPVGNFARTSNGQPKSVTHRSSTRRTATPIECKQADGTVFWTNASRCKDADLENRLSFAQAVKDVPRVRVSYGGSGGSSRAKPTQGKPVKSIPREMSFACSFPIGKARKIETKSLKLKLDPSDSVWKRSYCRWICEARKDGCTDIEDYLELSHLCPRSQRVYNYSCTT